MQALNNGTPAFDLIALTGMAAEAVEEFYAAATPCREEETPDTACRFAARDHVAAFADTDVSSGGAQQHAAKFLCVLCYQSPPVSVSFTGLLNNGRQTRHGDNLMPRRLYLRRV